MRDKERGLSRPHPLLPQTGTRKHREIRFAKLPPGQVERAKGLLERLDGLDVAAGALPNSVAVWYEIEDHTFEQLEEALRQEGFHLECSLYAKLIRALVYYSEDTQLRNMHGPQRLLKKSHEVYSKAWEHHPHGDHDDTPPELRVDR
ncbi:MAG: hypothetical protein KJ634_12750 [Gammaproteobacteria bacterium]|nr:hypothetical protein [Gammaproteobacteria bacterium]MBU1416484.1 hypothetical protein [Gammaproteobacteria bacterium]